MGQSDPLLTTNGRLVSSVAKLLKAYCKDVPPPERVKPITIQLVLAVFFLPPVSWSQQRPPLCNGLPSCTGIFCYFYAQGNTRICKTTTPVSYKTRPLWSMGKHVMPPLCRYSHQCQPRFAYSSLHKRMLKKGPLSLIMQMLILISAQSKQRINESFVCGAKCPANDTAVLHPHTFLLDTCHLHPHHICVADRVRPSPIHLRHHTARYQCTCPQKCGRNSTVFQRGPHQHQNGWSMEIVGNVLLFETISH